MSVKRTSNATKIPPVVYSPPLLIKNGSHGNGNFDAQVVALTDFCMFPFPTNPRARGKVEKVSIPSNHDNLSTPQIALGGCEI